MTFWYLSNNSWFLALMAFGKFFILSFKSLFFQASTKHNELPKYCDHDCRIYWYIRNCSHVGEITTFSLSHHFYGKNTEPWGGLFFLVSNIALSLWCLHNRKNSYDKIKYFLFVMIHGIFSLPIVSRRWWHLVITHKLLLNKSCNNTPCKIIDVVIKSTFKQDIKKLKHNH